MSIKFDFRGVSELDRHIRDMSNKVSTVAGRALREEAEIEMTEAKRRTPVDTGALRASGRVEGPQLAAGDVYVTLSFGGPAAPYALFVHENLDAYHKVGQAKYLESTLNESRPHMASRLAKRIGKLMGL